jgi:hypothetical protein
MHGCQAWGKRGDTYGILVEIRLIEPSVADLPRGSSHRALIGRQAATATCAVPATRRKNNKCTYPVGKRTYQPAVERRDPAL